MSAAPSAIIDGIVSIPACRRATRPPSWSIAISGAASPGVGGANRVRHGTRCRYARPVAREENVSGKLRQRIRRALAVKAGENHPARERRCVAHAIATPVATSKRRTCCGGNAERDLLPDARVASLRKTHAHLAKIRVDANVDVGSGRFATKDRSAHVAFRRDANVFRTNSHDRAVRRQQIHRPLAERARDRNRTRPVEDALRVAAVFDASVDQHRELVAGSHRFAVVVRHVEDRTGEARADAEDFVAHLGPKRRVQMRERLVQQQCLRIREQRAGYRDALPLAAGKFAGTPVEQRLDMHRCSGSRDARIAVARSPKCET